MLPPIEVLVLAAALLALISYFTAMFSIIWSKRKPPEYSPVVQRILELMEDTERWGGNNYHYVYYSQGDGETQVALDFNGSIRVPAIHISKSEQKVLAKKVQALKEIVINQEQRDTIREFLKAVGPPNTRSSKVAELIKDIGGTEEDIAKLEEIMRG